MTYNKPIMLRPLVARLANGYALCWRHIGGVRFSERSQGQHMKLSQTGPDSDKAGELVTRVVAESADVEVLRQEGYRIAQELGAKDMMWVQGPLSSKSLRMRVAENIFLGINPG